MRHWRRSAIGRDTAFPTSWETLEDRMFLSAVAARAIVNKATTTAPAKAVAPLAKAQTTTTPIKSAKPLFHTKPIAPRKPVVGTLAKPTVKAKSAPTPKPKPTPKSPAPTSPPPANAPPAPGAPLVVDYRLMGDANRDGIVNAADLKMVLAHIDRPGAWSEGDFNGDGRVDFNDYQILEVNFGHASPTHYATVGTNLDGIADYATIGAFTDLARMFRQWGRVETPYESDKTIVRTADNYPLEDAGAMTYARTYPDGVYKVSWSGNADVNFTGMGSEMTITSHVGDHWTADLALDHTRGEILNLYLTQIDPDDPVHDLHIISPDTDYARSPTFRPVFLDKLAAFNGPLRMMDWMQTNWNPAVTWADRTSPARFSNATDTGVDYESIIELANTLHKDVWVNVPYHADDDFVRNMAALFKANLDPSLKVYVEFSNEVWNTGTFQQALDNLNIARADDDPLMNRTDDFGRAAEEAGKQMGRVSALWRETYGGPLFGQRVRPVFGGFIATPYWAQSALEYIQRAYGTVRGYVSAISVAPYVGVQGDLNDIDDESLTSQKLFDWMHDFIDAKMIPWIQQNKSLADFYGLKLYAYEGGQSLQATNGQNEELKQAAQDDLRMGGVYKHLIQAWYDNSGGGLFENFSLATNSTPFGYWGALQSIDQATSVKWEAVLSTIAP